MSGKIQSYLKGKRKELTVLGQKLPDGDKVLLGKFLTEVRGPEGLGRFGDTEERARALEELELYATRVLSPRVYYRSQHNLLVSPRL